LEQELGGARVVGADLRHEHPFMLKNIKYEHLDVRDIDRYKEIVVEHEITHIFHQSAVMFPQSEAKIDITYSTNITGVLNALNVAKKYGCCLFIPSTMAVYGGFNYNR
jgi:threonine 3-dehydrogenase